ncbi:MAG: PqqD family protein [Oscillospiraceae bacterium]|nr:PqqD family protein [Oscillospiraceae bacterium]
MKLNPKFLMHETGGVHYIVSTDSTRFNGMVKCNETTAFIAECLKTDTTERKITDQVLAKYSGADRETVARDVARVIGKLRSIGAVIE